MKIKQIKKSALILFTLIAAMVGVATSSVNTETASAYICNDPNRPTDVWEYHEEEGVCWKVRYTESSSATLNPTTHQLSCPTNQIFHADDGTCWKSDGYTIEETGNIAPKNNNGTPLTVDNIACTNGFDYIASGKDTPGCYKKNSQGAYPCGVNQDVTRTGSRVANEVCGDTKNRIQPKNTSQSTDKTKSEGELRKAGADDNYLKQCQASGKSESECKFALAKAQKQCQDSADYNDCIGRQSVHDYGRCADNSKPDVGTGLCKDGSKPNLPSATTGHKCGQAETLLISCTGTGVSAIADVLKIAVIVLTTLIGVAAVGGLAYAAIRYAKAEDNQSQVSEARTLIRNIVIGLLLYGFLIAIVNWLIPGGVIG